MSFDQKIFDVDVAVFQRFALLDTVDIAVANTNVQTIRLIPPQHDRHVTAQEEAVISPLVTQNLRFATAI